MIELLNVDCMELLGQTPDKFYSLAIVDPPYGIGDFRSTRSRGVHAKVGWNEKIPAAEYFNELVRVSTNRIIWGVNYYGQHVRDVGRIVHDKTGGGKRFGPVEMSDCDIASHSFGVNMKIFHYSSIGNVIGDKVDWKNEMRWHPCQKPIALYRWLLKKYAKPGDKILDTHLGSMSSVIACIEEGYSITGCELDKDYYDAGMKRVQNHLAQQKMFRPEETSSEGLILKLDL